ncbi:M20/M25/M40 family metallo-hydrolase [Streptomyces rugosispiralis]|uniref:M20/M25/M40 family metallo-hydrolase n=1 Tax=Streptomyces rugosispiralis TaxID=2967341 RepID=A0ABT1VCG9_9ACTN|nr:M20/M25/M40 family metallo-hydrolase [Streptomyces rugosispiralis]MCQ8195092.1 M20/M25/M40 family metallo-hydrolase [Streptomyces rugosispiralis]
MSFSSGSTAPERFTRRLGQLVGIETPSGWTRGLNDVYDLLEAWAGSSLGRPRRVVRDGVPHLHWPGADPAVPRSGRVLLLGHADTVWPLGTLAENPFTVTGSRATGPGVFDMKAGLALAFEALGAAGDVSHVSMVVSGDEERGSATSRALVEKAAAACGAVLVLEPSEGGALKTARKGVAQYRLDVRGRAAHAGLEPHKGVNALVELAHQVLTISDLADRDRGTTVTPTVGGAGTTTNTVPEQAFVDVDVRAWERAELERVERALRALRPREPGAELAFQGSVNRGPLERGMSVDLLLSARAAAERLGLAPVTETSVGGGSDGNITASLGVPTLDGLGPDGGGAHARHEWVDLASVGDRTALIAGLLADRAP